MRVIIVGAGVVGAATAYFAAKQGHQVTLIDRHPKPAQGASFGNAGQLSYSYTDTLADPKLLRRLPAMLLGRDVGMRILMDAALLPWGVRFLWNCSRGRADRGTVQLLQLASESAAALEELLEDIPLEFAHRPAGKLLLTSSERTFAGLRRRAELKRVHGVQIEIIDAAECMRIEPALTRWRAKIAGAAYSRDDSAGDSLAFTSGLCERLSERGACNLKLDIEVRRLVRHLNRVVGVETQHGCIEAEAVIICAGVDTTRLLRGSGLCVPIYPLKGYSVTTDAGPHPPQVSLTDLDRRIVFSNLGGRIRLAGLADCIGIDRSVDKQRVADLVKLGRDVLPESACFDTTLDSWAGLRPATPSGLPIVGRTAMKGLFLNVGHGALGWTLACGTARQLAAQLV